MGDLRRRDDGVLPGLVVEAGDVHAIYNLMLRRDPEGPNLIEAHLGRALDVYFYSFLESPEFHGVMLPAIAGRAGWPPYRGRLPFDQLRAWLSRRSIFATELTDRLVSSRSWPDFFRTLLTDHEVLTRVPTVREAGSVVAQPNGEARAEIELQHADIEGDCDQVNVWEVKGWCVSHLDGGEKVTVEILVGGEVVGSAVCQEYRRDVQSRIGGDGACGFTYVIPPQVQETLREEQWLSVRERATGLPIGRAVALRYHGPSRLDSFDSLAAEVARARTTLDRLEAQLAGAAATLGYHISAYDEYVKAEGEPADADLEARLARAFPRGPAPLISVVLGFDGQDPGAATATLLSLAAQAYPNWELVVVGPPPLGLEPRLEDLASTGRSVIRRAGDGPAASAVLNEICQDDGRGAFMLMLSPGDRLRRDALLELAIAATATSAAAVYCDEDTYAAPEAGDEVRSAPRLKPGFDPDYLLSDDYIGHAVMFRTSVIAGLGGFARAPNAGGELDLILRIFESHGAGVIVHCPQVLIHMPAEAGARDDDATHGVVSEHLARTAPGASAFVHDDLEGVARAGALRIRWPLPAHPPTVSIIIPTKDRPELIGPCLASLRPSLSDYPGEVQIFVVDNGTTDSIALALMTSLAEMGAITLARYTGPFNWSALNNRAVTEARGEILVFLNNDTVMLRRGWLSELVGQALRREVGAVGARLLYGDRSIQHAGMVTGVAGATRHESVGLPVSDGGYLGRTSLQHRASAVTGACLATRRDVFETLGGFDEAAFKVSFNDTDYCMRVTAAGLAIVYTPFATMLHFESVSRGVGVISPQADEEMAAFASRWKDALRHDIYYNPHFDRTARPFTYLKLRRPAR